MFKNKLITGKGFINGKWVDGIDTFDVVNPATGKIIIAVADLNITATRNAITVAHGAWESTKVLSAGERSQFLKRWLELIIQHKRELAEIMTLESGKPLAESLAEVDYGASFVEWYAEEAKRAYGETIPSLSRGKQLITIKQGVGVVAAITPWNFPMAMITRKIAPAIAAGCTVVLRPASQTPLTALALAILTQEAEWLDGMFNVITGNDAIGIGKELSTNQLVRKLSFTGSTSVGKVLMQQASSTIKKVSLELGGNAPFIVFDDADIDAAVRGAVFAKYRNAGQTCIAVNRFLIQDGIFEEFADRLTEAVKSLKVGDGRRKGVQVGPLINEKGLKKVEAHVSDAIDKGARLLTGGESIRGLFYKPTVLADVPLSAAISNEETFGPIAALYRFNTEEEALKLANATEYGLASYLYSKDVDRCWRMATALEVGMVGINDGIISTAAAPFGGVKASGMGREGSRHGLEDYLEIKYLCFGLH